LSVPAVTFAAGLGDAQLAASCAVINERYARRASFVEAPRVVFAADLLVADDRLAAEEYHSLLDANLRRRRALGASRPTIGHRPPRRRRSNARERDARTTQTMSAELFARLVPASSAARSSTYGLVKEKAVPRDALRAATDSSRLTAHVLGIPTPETYWFVDAREEHATRFEHDVNLRGLALVNRSAIGIRATDDPTAAAWVAAHEVAHVAAGAGDPEEDELLANQVAGEVASVMSDGGRLSHPVGLHIVARDPRRTRLLAGLANGRDLAVVQGDDSGALFRNTGTRESPTWTQL
jgi:hypothetical protein